MGARAAAPSIRVNLGRFQKEKAWTVPQAFFVRPN
jgi:hypothetical protein